MRTDVWPFSGIDILPSLNRTNATDSGAPPDARISAGFMIATRYVFLPLAPTASGMASSRGPSETISWRSEVICFRAEFFFSSASPPLGPWPVTCSSSACASFIEALIFSTESCASWIAGMLKRPFLKSLESVPEKFS